MDFKGNVVIRPKYKRLKFAGKDKLLWAVDDKEDANIKLIDEDENVISKSEYEGVLPFYGSSAAVQVSKNSWIFIDEKGNEKKIKTSIILMTQKSVTTFSIASTSMLRLWLKVSICKRQVSWESHSI